LKLFMVSDVRLHGGHPVGGHALFDNLPAPAALQDIIRPPSHLPSILEAVQELFGKAAAFHPIQGGHLVQKSGASLC